MASYSERAQTALDELGWADSNDPMEIVQATMTLARLVKDMARELDRTHPRDSEPEESEK